MRIEKKEPHMPQVAALHSSKFPTWVHRTALAGALCLFALPAPLAASPVSRLPSASATFDDLRRSHHSAFKSGEIARAESLASAALELRRRESGPDHPDVATALLDVAEYAVVAGRDELALASSEEALRIRLRRFGPRHLEVAATRRQLARALIQPHRYVEAEALCRDALAIQQGAAGSGAESLFTQSTLAGILTSRGHIQGSERLLRTVVAGLRAAPGDSTLVRRELAAALIAHGRALSMLSRPLESEAAAAEALHLRRALYGERHPHYAMALQALATNRANQNDMVRAAELSKQAYEILRQCFGEESRPAVAHMNDVGLSLTGPFQQVERMEAYREGETWYRRADSLAQRVFGADHPQRGTILGNYGFNLANQGRHAEAESVLILAQANRQRAMGDDDAALSGIIGYRARLAYQMREFARSESLLWKRLRFVERERGTTGVTYLSIVEGLGIMRATRGDFVRAESLLTRATQVYENVRLRAGQGSARATIWLSPYERLAATRMLTGKPEAAWQAVERLYGLAIADMLLATGARPLSTAEKQSEDSLAAALTDLENLLSAARRASGSDSLAGVEAASLQLRLAATEHAWNVLHAESERADPLGDSRTFSLERVQQSLNGRTAVVGWLDAEFGQGTWHSWGYVIRDRGPVRWVRIDRGVGGIGWATRGRDAFMKWITAPAGSPLGLAVEDSTGQQRELWEVRVAPLLPQLEGVTDLVVVSSRGTRGLPIEALLDSKDRSLGDLFRVQYAPSATIFAWLSERAPRSRAIERGLLVGDPPFREEHLAAMTRGGEDAPPDSSTLSNDLLRGVLRGDPAGLGRLPRLRWARRELDAVAATLPEADRLIGPDASERALVARVREGRMKDYDVLHFATHAVISDQRPEESALVLAQVGATAADLGAPVGRALDGRLSGSEVLLEWSLDADLVTLSACETGLGQRTIEGTFGIAQSFLRAGARSVLVSLWKVNDESTAMLMERYYTNWLGHDSKGRVANPKSAALAEAKRWLREWRDERGRRRFEHPYYWAGFVLIGDAR
jgi:CHAT domain-containing protein